MTRNLLYIIASVALVLILASVVQKCSREKNVSRHTDNHLSILQVDSIKYAEKMERRRALDSVGVLLEAALGKTDTVYLPAKKEAKSLELSYYANPSPVLCDSVIKAKNKQIVVLEQRDSLNGELVKIKNSAIILQDSIIEDKHQTILSLSAGYKKATDDLERMGRKRVVISVGAGYGVGADLKPQPFAGVTIGYKLFEL